MEKTRIAFVASTLRVGGAENVLFNLVTRLPADRFETDLLFLREPGPVGLRLIRSGVPSVDSLERGRLDPSTLARVVAVFRSRPPDILFSLDHHNAMFWGRLASLIAGVPRRVVASHSTGRMESRRSFTRVDRALMRWTDAVVALSGTHAAYLRDVEGVDPGKIVVIENGIDTKRYESVDETELLRLRREVGLREGERAVTIIAALRPEKAHEAFLEAAKILVTERPDLGLKFLIVGDGPRRGAIEALRNRLGLAERVLLLGGRDDIPAVLGISSVVALPSHGAVETLPLAVLEAMAAGVPVVASAVGSVPDLMEDGRNGKLIAPADAVGLSTAVCHIMDNREGTEQIVRRARDTVRGRYTVEKMVSGYAELFRRLTGGRIRNHRHRGDRRPADA